MAFEPLALDVDDLVRRYAAGETAEDLGHSLGVSDTTIRRRLKARGVEIRQGPTYRTTDSEAVKERRARTRAERGLHIGPQETVFATLLDSLGVEYRQQVAVGRYNLDFALAVAAVAVEIVSGGGNTRSAANRRSRIEYLLDADWSVVEVFVRAGRAVQITRASAEYVVAFAEQLRVDPPARGEHRMIWADGELYAARTRHVD